MKNELNTLANYTELGSGNCTLIYKMANTQQYTHSQTQTHTHRHLTISVLKAQSFSFKPT